MDRAQMSATPTREEVGGAIKVEQQLQRVIFGDIKKGVIAGTVGNMLRTYIMGRIERGSGTVGASSCRTNGRG